MMACTSHDQETAMIVLQSLKELLIEVPNMICEFERGLFRNGNEDFLRSMEMKSTDFCSILSTFHADIAGLNVRSNIQVFGELQRALYELCMVAHRYRRQFKELIEWSPLQGSVNGGTQFHLEITVPANIGRPKVYLSKEQVSALISMGFKLADVSSMLGVHPKTLRRMRREWEFPVGENMFTDITDEGLDESISEVLHELPNTGERLMIGALASKGIRVQRTRIRESLQRLDPVGKTLRRRLKIRRRTYNVPCANFLWYILIWYIMSYSMC